MTVGAGVLLVLYPLIDVVGTLVRAASVDRLGGCCWPMPRSAQLFVAIRRRAQLGKQWPLRLAGGFSVIAGVAYITAAAGGDPRLMPLVIYTATGGAEFVIQAWLLARRRRHPAKPADAILSPS